MTELADTLREAILRTETVACERIHANPWNPNKMDERTRQAARESIATYGFIDPVTVREHPEIDGHFQIIDGEHRWQEAQELGYDAIPVVVLGVDDTTARKLTIVFNETRGEADSVLLGTLLKQLEAEDADFRTALRYDDGELKHLLSLAEADWDDFNAQQAGDDREGDDDEWRTISARVPKDFMETWEQVISTVQERDGHATHDDQRVREGQALEVIAAAYLAGS
jgi:ParB-like nuclease domain